MNAISRPAELQRPPTGLIRPEPRHFFSGSIPADAYGCPLDGDCLAPEICDGDMALVSPSEAPSPGDFVVLYFVGGRVTWLKRLVMAPPVPIGTKLAAGSEVGFLVIVEMLNPHGQFAIPTDKLTAMHRVVGMIRKAEVAGLMRAATSPARRRRGGAA